MLFRSRLLISAMTALATVSMLTPALYAKELVWPAPPADPRIELLRVVDIDELSMKSGFLGKARSLLTGRSEADKISLPFDLVAADGKLFATCQNVAALLEIDLAREEYRLYRCKDDPLLYPIAVCDGGEGVIFLSDAERGAIYRLEEGRLELFITADLVRPTGLTAFKEADILAVIDTGDQTIKYFDFEGKRVAGGSNSQEFSSLNYPTFACSFRDSILLVNDVLNFEIKMFDLHGQLLGKIGGEGSGPGKFARPKGVSIDEQGHVYVVDNLFDNFQVFDTSGSVLLVVGERGNQAGQFWSPAGIDIQSDTIYVADTYNNRIQVFKLLEHRK